MKVLKFYASWCQPCKNMSRLMESMENLPEIEEVDIDEKRELATHFMIRSVPTLVKLDDTGKEVERYAGGATDKTKIQEFLGV